MIHLGSGFLASAQRLGFKQVGIFGFLLAAVLTIWCTFLECFFLNADDVGFILVILSGMVGYYWQSF